MITTNTVQAERSHVIHCKGDLQSIFCKKMSSFHHFVRVGSSWSRQQRSHVGDLCVCFLSSIFSLVSQPVSQWQQGLALLWGFTTQPRLPLIPCNRSLFDWQPTLLHALILRTQWPRYKLLILCLANSWQIEHYWITAHSGTFRDQSCIIKGLIKTLESWNNYFMFN